MLCREPGVLPPSDYYFATPSAGAKELFYYLLCAGEYSCAPDYLVSRRRYNSVLLLCVLEGGCTVRYEGEVRTASAGDIVLLDCYREHEYRANGPMKCVWVHFDGGQSLDFVRSIHRQQGVVLTPREQGYFTDAVRSILNIFRQRQPLVEAELSSLLYAMLCRLVSPTLSSGAEGYEMSPLYPAVEFIKARYQEKITVRDMAKVAVMSPAHFSRQFKKETGFAPYEYLTRVRLDEAKKLLKKTQLPVAEIAERTGFQSASSFICCFSGKLGITPKQFRAMPF